MIRFEPMTEADIPAALALWQGMPGIGLRDADNPVSLTRYLARNPRCSYTAKENDALIGVGLAGHDGRRGYLHHVAVAPDRQRGGIGRRLVECCLAALKKDGIDKVNFWVEADNGNGLAFWKRIGGIERTDLVVVSMILGDNPNA